MLKRLIWGVACLLMALVWFAYFAGIRASMPLQSSLAWAAPLPEAQSIGGEALPSGEQLLLRGADPNGVTGAMWPLEAEQAVLPIVRLCVEGVDELTRTVLLWRSGGQLRRQLLQGTGNGCLTLSTERMPDWQGEIDAVGIAWMPVDYVPVLALPQRDVRLLAFELRDDSMTGRAAALWDWWFAYTPWNGRSINTQGFSLGPVAGPSFYLFLLALTLSAIATTSLLRVASIKRCVQVGVVVSVGSLAIGQVAQTGLRADEAYQAHQALDGRAGQALAAMPALAEEARSLSDLMHGVAVRRVLIGSKDRFAREYALWWLRRWDAAFVWPEQWAGLVPQLRAEDVMVMAGRDDTWSYDAASATLSVGAATLPNTRPIFEGTWLFAYQTSVAPVAEAAP